jgi:hypothetical protein
MSLGMARPTKRNSVSCFISSARQKALAQYVMSRNELWTVADNAPLKVTQPHEPAPQAMTIRHAAVV